MNPLFGEELLATLHLAPFLRREHPFVTKALHAEAMRLPKKMRLELRAFIDDDPPEKQPKPASFDYLQTLEQVSRPVQPQDIENMVGAHQEPSDALDVYIPLTRALAFLSGIAPRRSKQTLTGVIQLVPSDQEVERFRRAYVVADDPFSALVKLRRMALLGDEVAALASIYPELYKLIGNIVGEELAAAKERKGAKWNIAAEKEHQLMLLMQMAPSDAALVKDMQDTFGDQPQPEEGGQPQAKSSRVNLKADSFRTGAQASEAGGR